MKHRVLLFLSIICCFNSTVSFASAAINGKQPNSAVDLTGVIRVAYGKSDTIYCITSNTNGQSFSRPVLVAVVPGMHLGNSRGPQIASSSHYSMITAIDKTGDIHSFKLDHSRNVWTTASNVNDLKGSAPEGLMSITADANDHFFAVWLDIRLAKMNNIYYSMFTNNTSWKKNKLIYRSPEGHVCECCKPNISWNKNQVAITFRNWMKGSRDIYYTTSANNGLSFTSPIRSGYGTWKLDGCPMDGGGSAITEKGILCAAWQRNGEVFYANGNLAEQKLGSGHHVSLARAGNNTFIAWQEDGDIKLYNLNSKKLTDLGKGTFARLSTLPGGKVFCVWEEGDGIAYKIAS